MNAITVQKCDKYRHFVKSFEKLTVVKLKELCQRHRVAVRMSEPKHRLIDSLARALL